jgi:HKD family nuclease
MNKCFLFLLISIFSIKSWAVKLSDYRPYNFEALFTNPVCETYHYNRPVITHSGKTISSKPDDVYCKQADEAASVDRKNAPQFRLREWITDSETKELFLAYLSFSNKNVVNALCSAVKKGVKVTIVLDQGDAKTPSTNKDAEGLKKCGKEELVNVYYRGSTGGLGFAHNKIMMVNPSDKVVKIVWSSGNISSGTSINHENWNFVTTSGESFFAQAHKCALEGMVVAGESRGKFNTHMNDCRAKIKNQPETDIEVFFVPTDGKKALARFTEAGNRSHLLEGMGHRLSGELAETIAGWVTTGKPVKFILDDDIYWSAKLGRDIGRNTRIEAFKLYNDLINKGMQTRFLQTNQNVFQLQHNKFMIFNFKNGGAVFNGAGNFTTSAFTKNFENFYFIQIPEVVAAYKKQYELYFEKMATAEEDMPRDYILP